MSKSEQTKEKLLALMDILRRDTDEDHHLLVKDIIERLNQRGIAAERKSLYRDISILEEAGWDIMHDRKGYYLASDTFELAELKLLVDAIQCSRFITEKKSYELIEKLESLTSQYRANQLRRQLFLVGRPKTSNEQIYYNIDTIYTAINSNSEIVFDYMIEFISDGENIGVVTAEYGNAIYTINVLPIPQFDIASIFDNNASTIRFVVNGIDNGNPFNGDVCVSVDGKDYLFSIVNGTAISDVINDIAHPAIYNAKIIFYGDENHQLISMEDEELEVIGNSLSDLAYIIAKNIRADIYELSLDRDFSYDPNTDSPEGILLDNELIGEDKTFTLHGNGHTIDGIGQSRIFYLNNTNLVLDGISVINANSSAGGAIYSENSTLTISNSIFKNNNASDGGVIFADKSSSLAITGSLFEDNTAHNGAVINSKGLVTMDASNFTNNSAHNGGVIYADSGSITVNNSLFSENDANAQGGVIYNRGQLKVFDSIFSIRI